MRTLSHDIAGGQRKGSFTIFTILERKLAEVELKNDEGNEFQRGAVRNKKFCLDAFDVLKYGND